MDDWYYETDVVQDPIAKRIKIIYRKYRLYYTGKEYLVPLGVENGEETGGDLVGETERYNVKRISREEYKNETDEYGRWVGDE